MSNHCHISVEQPFLVPDPGFPRREMAHKPQKWGRQPINWPIVSRKLHKILKNWK